MIRLLIAGFVFGLFLLGTGLQGTYEGMVNRTPLTMTMDEFEKNRPTGGWITIKGCTVSVLDGMWSTDITGKVEKVYIPIYSGLPAVFSGTEKKHAVLLLVSHDPGLVQAQQEMHDMDQNKANDQQFSAWMDKNRNLVVMKKDISGMLMHGLDKLDDSERGKIEKLDSTLDADFAVLEDGKKPDLGGSMLSLLGGIVLTGGSVALGIARFRTPAKRLPTATVIPPTGSAPPRIDVRAETPMSPAAPPSNGPAPADSNPWSTPDK